MQSEVQQVPLPVDQNFQVSEPSLESEEVDATTSDFILSTESKIAKGHPKQKIEV
jgi:hypothetical protein